MEEKKYWAWLSTVEGIYQKKIKKLLKKFEKPSRIYFADEKALKAAQVKDKDIELIIKSKEKFNAKLFFDELEKKEIRFITRECNEFSEKLCIYEHAPYYLYYKGKMPDSKSPAVAMVGARACSNYGRNMARNIANGLSSAGIQVISGMARGVDTYSQIGALSGGGKTFAVLGSGVDVCYPIENIELYNDILKNGGIISEYPPGAMPLSWHFPQRNRIISGLADNIAVIEAKEKSGSLITVEWALEQGKDVFAVPGRVGDILSSGCNRLIKAGAGMLTSEYDILEELNIEHRSEIEKNANIENSLEKDFAMVYIELSLYPMSIEEIIEKTQLEYYKIIEILLQLQLMGLVEQPMENYYAKTKD